MPNIAEKSRKYPELKKCKICEKVVEKKITPLIIFFTFGGRGGVNGILQYITFINDTAYLFFL